MRLGNQRGEGRLGFLISAAVLATAVFIGVKVIPVRINGYNFHDRLREECRMGAVHQDDTKLAKRLLEEAHNLGIPLSKKNLKIYRTQKKLTISATYEQEIDLKFTTYTYKFNKKEEAPIF